MAEPARLRAGARIRPRSPFDDVTPVPPRIAPHSVPAQYEQRVIGFFDRALLGASG